MVKTVDHVCSSCVTSKTPIGKLGLKLRVENHGLGNDFVNGVCIAPAVSGHPTQKRVIGTTDDTV